MTREATKRASRQAPSRPGGAYWRKVMRKLRDEKVEAHVAVYAPKIGLVARDQGAKNDLVVMSRDSFDEIVARLEEAADRRAFDEIRAGTRPEDYLPAELVDRLIAGESAVRIWREHRALTMGALAEKAGISPSYLSEIETGKKPGSTKALKALAEALEVDLDDLV